MRGGRDFSYSGLRLLPAVPLIDEEISQVAEASDDGIVSEAVLNVASDKRDGGKSHTVYSRHFRKKGDVKDVAQSTRKIKGVSPDEPWLSMHRRMLIRMWFLPRACPRESQLPMTSKI